MRDLQWLRSGAEVNFVWGKSPKEIREENQRDEEEAAENKGRRKDDKKEEDEE